MPGFYTTPGIVTKVATVATGTITKLIDASELEGAVYLGIFGESVDGLWFAANSVEPPSVTDASNGMAKLPANVAVFSFDEGGIPLQDVYVYHADGVNANVAYQIAKG